MTPKQTEILAQIEALTREDSGTSEEKLGAICNILAENFEHYNWVGVYIAEPERRELVLGPFVGEPTEHIRIPYGRGICGQAAQTLSVFVVDDVSKEQNYLACSPKVKSEIVLPVFVDGEFVAELDIDSHYPGAFSRDDKEFLERVCEYAAKIFKGKS